MIHVKPGVFISTILSFHMSLFAALTHSPIKTQVVIILKGNEVVAKALESEFRKTLTSVTTLAEFTQQIGKLLGFMGLSEFSVFHWTSASYYLRQAPKILINNTSKQFVDQAISYLLNAAAMGLRPNKALLDIYYEETESRIDPTPLAVRRGCCLLSTQAANYGYIVRKDPRASSCQQVLCIVDKTKSSDQFRVQIKNNRLALDTINRIIADVGVDRFPTHFTARSNEDESSVGSKPLSLLNVIAQNDVTLSQAAEMLDISVDTANKKIAKIKSDLGVSTLPSAVLYAANKGLIDKVL